MGSIPILQTVKSIINVAMALHMNTLVPQELYGTMISKIVIGLQMFSVLLQVLDQLQLQHQK